MCGIYNCIKKRQCAGNASAPATKGGKSSKNQVVEPATNDGKSSNKQDVEPATPDDKASKTQDVESATTEAKTAAKAAAKALPPQFRVPKFWDTDTS